MMDIFSSSRQDAASSSASAPAPAPLLPIIFCGPGSNLYPLCDPSSSSSSSTTESLPKAILPVANRPLIAYPLQHLASAGFKRVLVVAPSTQHRAIEVALKGLRLQVPHVSEGKATGGAKDNSKGGANMTDETNIAVVDGLSAAVTSKAAAAPSGPSAAMRVELIPLGPYDVKGAGEIKGDAGQDGSDQLEFRRVARPGTAELLRWLAHIGKLESDPLVLPVDFIAPSLPISSFLLSYYSASNPAPPTVISLLYERGAGESVGREREKEAPPRTLAAYSHASPATSSCSSSSSSSLSDGLSTHSLLLLSELPSGSTLDVRLSLLKAHPRTRFSTNLLDSHIYILRRDQIVPLLNARKDFTSLREHVVPFVAKAGWQTGLIDKVGWGQLMREEAKKKHGRSGYDEVEEGLGDVSIGGEAGGLMQLAFQRSSLALPTASPTRPEHDAIRAVTVVARLEDETASASAAPVPEQPSKGGKRQDGPGASKGGSVPQEPAVVERFFARANTLPTYLESNRFLLRSLFTIGQSLVAAGGGARGTLPFPLPAVLPSTSTTAAASTSAGLSAGPTTHEISPSAQVSPDTLIPLLATTGTDEDPRALLTISDRASLKRSLLAVNVHLSRNAKVSGSILMEGCSIGEGAKLDNCIVGPGARVGDGCNLKDVDLGPGAKVSGKKDVKGEKIAKGEQGEDDEESGDEGSEDED
ncbi:hypothetical protein BCV69DRAFT_279924 [Microstroma glucosiphilum]|uniref:Translation initiation factor eIF2B subunit gamma n=1 Tax=Pseudomicrostroma glucosiphilum TaxID=1684307 RepID=A0A316UFK2_9BASI|nr:hypothetical protein BCV69DRAFT_279924 [Pseudomicrostroma glucosiphilum]PWN24019.1 hypothetical protein BCV69DRAFT_279924 [Pseudomicrostroma glucosiphilum]